MVSEICSQITCVFNEDNTFHVGRRMHDDPAFAPIFYNVVRGVKWTCDNDNQTIIIRTKDTKNDVCKVLGPKYLARILCHDELQDSENIKFS